jgi:hypothetical protein
MRATGRYPLSSDGIYNVKDSEFVRGRTALKAGGDGINKSTSINLGWRVRQLGRMRDEIKISSYVLILVARGDLCDGFDLGLVYAGWLQILQRL